MFKVYIVPVGPSNVAPIVRWQTRGGDIWNIWRQAAQAEHDEECSGTHIPGRAAFGFRSKPTCEAHS